MKDITADQARAIADAQPSGYADLLADVEGFIAVVASGKQKKCVYPLSAGQSEDVVIAVTEELWRRAFVATVQKNSDPGLHISWA